MKRVLTFILLLFCFIPFVKGEELTATFYYNSNTTSGELTVSSLSSTCDTGNDVSCTVDVPDAVSSSIGQYNSPFKGVVNVLNNMNPSELTISENTTFYAIYNTPVSRYYYNNGYKNNTINRNEYFISDTEMKAVLATVDNGLNNYTAAKGPSSSVWVGLSETQDTIAEYDSVQAAANSSTTTIYTVYQFNINYQLGANVNSIGQVTDNCKVTTGSTRCDVILPSITAKAGFTVVGWGTMNGDTNGLAVGSEYTIETNNSVLYANAVLDDPHTPTIDGGESKVYGEGSAILSCETDTEYGEGVNIFYSFGYATSENGTVGNWSSSSTNNSFETPEAYGERYYACRIYASDGSSSSYTVTSENTTLVSYVNARIDFNGNNGTVNGANTIYVPYGATNTYTGRLNTNSVNIPSAAKINAEFIGWYTASKNGEQVIDENGNILPDITGWTDANGRWKLTDISNEQDTHVLYANYLSTLNEVTATFYYNSNTENGSLTVSTENVSCEIASGSSCLIEIPSAVTNSVGKYNGAFLGVSRNTNNLTDGILTLTEDQNFYAFYTSEVTLNYYDDQYTNKILYRNEFFTSNSEMNAVLADSNNSTSNYETANGYESSTWEGLSEGQDTTVEYTTVDGAANSLGNVFYTVYSLNINYIKSSNIDVIGADSDSCKITTSDTSCAVMLPSITPKGGYTSIGWGEQNATTGNDPLTLYILDSNKELYANAIINDPLAPSITSSGQTVLGYGTMTLTCADSNDNDGITSYYSFGSTLEENGEITNWTQPSTTNTYVLPDEHGVKYYSCRIYLTDGTQTSNTLTSDGSIEAYYVNARIDFNPNGANLSGNSPLYVSYGSSNLYTTRTGDTTSELPVASKRKWAFTGWYTAAEGGNKVIDVDGTIIPGISRWTDANGNFKLTNTSDAENSQVLYAQFIDHFDYEILNYEVDETNKYISKIVVNTELEAFLSNIDLGVGYTAEVDTTVIDNKNLLFTGSKTIILNNTQPYAEYTNIVIGDINGDGYINSGDLLKIRQHLLKIITLEGPNYIAADVNYDESINSADLLRVRQHLLKIKLID